MVSYYSPLTRLTVRVHTQSHIDGVVLLAVVVLLTGSRIASAPVLGSTLVAFVTTLTRFELKLKIEFNFNSLVSPAMQK